MYIITTYENIANLAEKFLLNKAIEQYLNNEYVTLRTALQADDQVNFTLEAHGYQMVMIASCKECDRLSADHCCNVQCEQDSPEYVELVQLIDGTSLYRACFMPDNECYILVYAIKGALAPNVEQWFTEQAGCSAVEAEQ